MEPFVISEFPAGLRPSVIELILGADDDVLYMDRISNAKNLRTISTASGNNPPIEVLIDNGINDIYVPIGGIKLRSLEHGDLAICARAIGILMNSKGRRAVLPRDREQRRKVESARHLVKS